MVVKDIAEVGATGRCKSVPFGVQRADYALTHAFLAYYIPTAWVSLCLFTTKAVVGLE